MRRAAAWVVAALGLAAAAGADPGKPAAFYRPGETADAVLIREATSWDRRVHDALGLPDWLDLAVEQRTRFEYLEDPFRPGEPDTQTQYPLRTRLRIGVDGPRPLRLLAEIQDARAYGDGPRDFTASEFDRVDVLQLFASASARDLFGSGLRGDVHAGRMTLDLGARRTLARNGFRNTTNAFDGAHLSLGASEGAWRVRAFYARPVLIDPGYVDDESTSNQRFWGLALEDERIPWLNFDLSYLGLRDRIGGREYHTLGARALRPAKTSQLDYELELIGQFGDRGELDHSAFAGHLELGYTLALPWSPRLVGQFDYASGTADPNGDESHTFDPLFGARRGDLVVTGIFGPFRRSNIFSPGVRLVASPRPGVKLQIKLRYWELAQARDAFVGTGLRDATGDAGRQLGTDVELSLQWSPTPWLTLEAGYDHWFKGSYLDRVANVPSTGDSDYVYVSSQLRF
jgi:hypothetical protein